MMAEVSNLDSFNTNRFKTVQNIKCKDKVSNESIKKNFYPKKTYIFIEHCNRRISALSKLYLYKPQD